MSEALIINTENNVIKNVNIKPLSIFTEGTEYLSNIVPEYSGTLPNSAISELVDRMKITMKEFGGIGLAANQCGFMLRLFIIGSDNFQITCINPKIIKHSENIIKDREGCLSYPALFLNKERFETIEVEYLNELGELKNVEFSGLTARIFQHELDHLDGKLFTDNVGSTTMLLAREKQKKLIKKFSRRIKNESRKK